MKELYMAKMVFPSYDYIAKLKAVDEEDIANRNLDPSFTKIGKRLVVDNTKFEFSQDFIDELLVMYIFIDYIEDYEMIKIECLLNGEQGRPHRNFMFKSNKKEINFWKDIDYIMENLVEKYGRINIPISKQIQDITYIALGRI